MRQFGKRQATAIKGIAILMMFWHHLYLNMDSIREAGLDVSFFPFPEYNMVNLAKVSKICVSLYAIVSGYGLYLDYSGTDKKDADWIRSRLKKLLTDYWFIYIVLFMVTMVIDQRPVKVYFAKNIFDGCVNILLDFLGLASIFGSLTMIGTWWYMGAAVIYITVTPYLVRNRKHLWAIFAVTGVTVRLMKLDFLGGTNPYSFLCAFQIGIIAAHYDIVNFFVNLKGRAGLFLAGVGSLWLGYRLYTYLPYGKYWELCWAFFPLVVVIFSVRYIVDLPLAGDILHFLGKHSYFLFLTHSFIRQVYLRDFIYNRNCFVSFALLLIISLVVTLACEWLESILGFRKIVDRICGSIAQKYAKAVEEYDRLRVGRK